MSDKILKFSAIWCGPCALMTKMLDGVDLGIPVEEIDVDVKIDIASKFGIRGVPTLVRLRDGVEVARLVGSKRLSELQSWVAENSPVQVA